jgi:hypothetical protein
MSQAELRHEEVIEMHGWTWGCGRYGWRPWGWRAWEGCWPAREDRIRWLLLDRSKVSVGNRMKCQ